MLTLKHDYQAALIIPFLQLNILRVTSAYLAKYCF